MAEQTYLRRVRRHNPMLQQLAEQAVDTIQRVTQPGTPARFFALAEAAREYGVPLDYVLDELERRVRERVSE